MPDYKPTESYIVQSGKKKGKSIEQMMFTDYAWLVYMKNLLNAKKPASKNSLHKHIEWVLHQGETRKPTLMCPQCNKKPVKLFSVLGSQRHGYSMSSYYTCCGDPECQHKLRAQGMESVPLLLPISFSSISMFQFKLDRKRVADILRDCFKLPKRLTKEVLFAFFND